MRRTTLTFILTLTTMSELPGQEQFPNQITPDSVVKKLKIRQVTENWFTSSSETVPSNTTCDLFDEFGNRIQRMHINYLYHKFINNYLYDYKKGVIIDRQEYYDWNPNREKNKGDTVIKKSVHQYFITTNKSTKVKPSGIDKFSKKYSYNAEGKIIQQIDSIKFGYETTYFTYDNNGQLNERRRFISRFSEKAHLESIDSLFYNSNSLIISKEINYYNIRNNESQIVYDRVVERKYKYNELGLLIEKEILEKYLSLNGASKPTIYRYDYEFF